MDILNFAARIRLSGELGGIVMIVLFMAAIIGIAHSIFDFIIFKIILRNLNEEQQQKHILSKILNWATAIASIIAIVLIVLELMGSSTIIYDVLSSFL